MMKYLLFTYYVGRALGGMKDYIDGFDSVEEASKNILVEKNRYFQIVDRDALQVVKEGLAIFKDFSAERFSSDDSLL